MRKYIYGAAIFIGLFILFDEVMYTKIDKVYRDANMYSLVRSPQTLVGLSDPRLLNTPKTESNRFYYPR